jgi:lysophospholipase L1-like esterase
MRCTGMVLLATLALAQQIPQSGPLLGDKEAGELATRMLQLVESTAVAVPGLVRAGEPVTQSAQMTLAAMLQTPRNPTLTWQFMNEMKAYLALADSLPHPYPFPAAADRQYAELREGVERFQQHFEALLTAQSTADQGRAADPNGLARYADANTKLLPAENSPRTVFLGDSITDSWRLNEYFTGRDFVNRGIGGQTTSQMLARFRQDVIALNPKIVVILGGTNDIASGVGPRQIEDNLAMMGDLAKAHGIKVAFASITPVSDYHKDADPRYEVTKTRPPATIKEINTWIQTLCMNGGFAWMDYYSVLIDTAGQMAADFSDDGLHPNGQGYRRMSPVVIATIDRILSRQAQEETPESKRRFRLLGR